MPFSATECGELGPSSFTVRKAALHPDLVRGEPDRLGAARIRRDASAPAQFPPVIRKLFGFEPVRRTFEIVSGPLVRLVSVIVFGVENVPA